VLDCVFKQELTAKNCFNLRGEFELGLLNNVGIVTVLWTLGDELNAFSIMSWP
jgi:hypothetical protein